MYVLFPGFQVPINRFCRVDSIHLKQCVTMYLFSLPFVLVKELGWATVPVVTVVAFTFMGIETIADIIEMPFGMCFRLLIVLCSPWERR
jgi:predicted membrane chloride channel (bestrophin family)